MTETGKVTLTLEQKELIRSTWAHVVPILDDVTGLFYGRLFEIDPTTEELFGDANMEEQRKKLMQTLKVAVANIDRLDEIRPALEALGSRHVSYAVRDEHYESVGAALLWALGQGLGEEFTAEAEEAWAELYGHLASIMKEGMEEVM